MTSIRTTGFRSHVLAVLAAVPFCLAVSSAGHAAGLIDKIKARGKLVVGTEAAFEPFEFRRNGKIVGYNKEILDYVVLKLGVKLEQLDLPFQGLLPGLLAGKFDVMATSTAINAKRAARYAFTRPIGTGVNVVLVRAGDGRIKTLDDLRGKVAATQLASVAQPRLEAFDKKLKANGGKGLAAIKLFTSFPETHVALASRQVDAILIASPTAAVLIKKIPNTFRVVGKIGRPAYLSWVLRPEDGELRDFINARIAELKANGTLKKLQMKWFGFEMETPASNYLPKGAK